MSLTQPPSSNQRVIKTVVAMAVATLATAVICFSFFFFFFFFFFFWKFARCRRHENKNESSFRGEGIRTPEEFNKFGKDVKGLIVEENGQDVLYTRNSDGQLKTIFPKVMINPSYEEEEEEKMMDVMMERLKKPKSWEASSLNENSQAICYHPETATQNHSKDTLPLVSVILAPRGIQSTQPLPSPSTHPEKKVLALLPPPPSSSHLTPPLPPHPPPPPPPPPPPLSKKEVFTPRSAPPLGGSVVSSLKPPPASRGITSNKITSGTQIEESSKRTHAGQMKLKPLHWDKVTANCDQSMVWNEINDGSLR